MINYINPTSQFYQFWPNWTKSPIRIHTSPKNFNFSKFTKLINHQDQVYNIIGTKSNDQFQNIWLESTKIPKRIDSKIPTKCMKKNALKHENKCKRNGKMDLSAWRKENLAKRSVENDKNLRKSLCRVEERKKSLKNFWKVSLNKSNLVFKKLDSRFSIDQKSVSIDRNKQRLTKKFWINLNWSKNSLDQSKIQKKHSFKKNSQVFA